MPAPIDPDEMADRLARQAARQMAGWHQIELAGSPDAGGVTGPSPSLAAAIATSVQRWQDQVRLDGWFFARSTTGLRLRLHAPATVTGLEAVLESWCGRVRGDGLVRAAVRRPYEPEEYRFGGAVGTALAHRHFEVDSATALALVQLRDRQPDVAALPPGRLAMILTNDLIARVVDDGAELWDVWHRLDDAAGTTGSVPDLAGARASLSGGLDDVLPAVLHPIVGAAQDANAAVAEALLADPAVPRRAWLAAVTAYDWNRHGLTADDVAPMTSGILAVLDGRDTN